LYISVFYFKVEKINIFILLQYRNAEDGQKIVLDEVKFFNSEIQVKDYINENILRLEKSRAILDVKNIFENYFNSNEISIYKELKAIGVDLAIFEKFPTDFKQRVINVVANLKHGETISYSEIGEKINSKAYRAIGSVLSTNPIPLVIPCHRVIKKSGELGGFMGQTDETWQKTLKKNLITLEGLNKG